MIELIFVIVIIGILAAVALPKITATRGDAKLTKAVANIRTCWGDVNAYLLSQGKDNFKADFTSDACDGAVGKDTYKELYIKKMPKYDKKNNMVTMELKVGKTISPDDLKKLGLKEKYEFKLTGVQR